MRNTLQRKVAITNHAHRNHKQDSANLLTDAMSELYPLASYAIRYVTSST